MGQQSAVVQTITPGVNETRFIGHMRTLFSSSTVVLSELMQNARRAGASAVMFHVNDTNLVVVDDGCGIADFSKLVVVAESGWDDKVLQEDDPFGIGFLATVFSADSVLVESRGHAIRITAADFAAKNQIQLQPASFIGGTRVTLEGFKHHSSLAGALGKYAKGFSLPVFLDGEELPRKDALQSLSGWQETPVGALYIPDLFRKEEEWIGYTNKPTLQTSGNCYCQGLPVNAGGFTQGHYRFDSGIVLHIDHKKFKPRMPDRDSLIDQDLVGKEIDRTIHSLWVTYLQEAKQTMTPAFFAELFWNIASQLACGKIMNDVPVLPTEVLYELCEYPQVPHYSESSFGHRKAAITRAEVESGEVTLCSFLDEVAYKENILRMMVADKLNWVFVTQGALSEGHWAHEYILKLDEVDLQVEADAKAEQQFWGNWVEGTVKVVDTLTVVLHGHRVEIESPVSIEDDESCTFIVPAASTFPSEVLRQASSYLNGNEDFMDMEHSHDCTDFDNLIAIMRGEPPEITLYKCLQESAAFEKKNLVGKSFSVVFDAEGKPAVHLLE